MMKKGYTIGESSIYKVYSSFRKVKKDANEYIRINIDGNLYHYIKDKLWLSRWVLINNERIYNDIPNFNNSINKWGEFVMDNVIIYDIK